MASLYFQSDLTILLDNLHFPDNTTMSIDHIKRSIADTVIKGSNAIIIHTGEKSIVNMLVFFSSISHSGLPLFSNVLYDARKKSFICTLNDEVLNLCYT